MCIACVNVFSEFMCEAGKGVRGVCVCVCGWVVNSSISLVVKEFAAVSTS